MLELLNVPFSTCSQKVRLALAEKQLPYKERRIDFSKREHLSDWYLKLNPNGVVPTLLHDGTSIVDSSVINEYLDDAFPHTSLRPRDLKRRAQMRAWRQYFDEVITPAIRVPSFNAFFVRVWSQFDDDQFSRYAERLPLRKHFYQRMGTKGFGEQDTREALEKIEQTLQRMEKALAEDGPWLVGEDFSLADISVTPSVVRLDDLDMQRMWDDKPHVADWYERIQARPSFAAAYYAGSRDLRRTG